MASIVRTEPTDDDGSGTTGTVINKAWLDALYDAIDAAISGSLGGGLKQKSANYTALNTDSIIEATSGSFTITLHAASDATRGTTPLLVKNSGSGTVTIDGDASELIDGQTTVALGQRDSVTLISNGSAWMIV